MTYKENLTHLTADLSAETLQARREWQDISKVMKCKNLTRKITLGVTPERTSFKIEGKIKSFTGKQKLRESAPPNQLYNSSITNAKGTSLDRKHKRKKRSTKTNSKQ